MGKRKNKPKNIVKVDLGEYEMRGELALPVLVQQTSKDGRCVERTVHKIPVSRAKPPPPPQANPPPPTFDPFPMFEDTQDASPGVWDPADELSGTERVRPRFLSRRRFLTRTPIVVRPFACLVP